MGFFILLVGVTLTLFILLWITLIAVWTNPSFDSGVVTSIALISGVVVVSGFAAASVVFFLNKARLDRIRAQSLELELAKNLVIVNEYRKTLLDVERALDGK